MKASAGKPRRVLIIVENLPVPFDRRVWQESNALRDAGYLVSIICPVAKGYEKKFEIINDIHIYRHSLPIEAENAVGYALEYGLALFHEFRLALKISFTRGFDVIHACNPPDTIFIIGAFFKLFGKKFLFDHHDINPELFEAKFARKDLFYKIICIFERLTFMTSTVSIATNESYKKIAIERGKMDPDSVFVVRSGPKLERLQIIPPVESLKQGKKYLVGYVGVMGAQEGIDYLLRAARYIVYKMGRTDIHFGLVGGGTSLEEMRAYATTLGLDEYVEFTGRVPDQKMLEILNTADICVNPDIANEMNDKSTMNKIMEYMALGKPVIQFDLREGRFSAQEASSYVRKNDEVGLAKTIVELLDDPDK
ncbi:MAG: glycosyltransferase family 4 protein, partial [Gammaproteobacteria bacterium]|nr:glycosyltransferase family 4 protein [Gammaproteobacteria bacterium]